jgi:hypothetical protein
MRKTYMLIERGTEDFLQDIKVEAVNHRVTVKQYILQAVQEKVEREVKDELKKIKKEDDLADFLSAHAPKKEKITKLKNLIM